VSGARHAAGLGLESEDLRAALADALAGRDARLGDLLSRHGGLPGPRPNVALATAFGEELAKLTVGAQGKSARRLLAAFAADDAKADTAHVFLPVAAAFGYVARLETDARDAWSAVLELTADDRAPVRVGLVAALAAWAAKAGGGGDALIAQAEGWLEHDDREHRDAATGIVLDVIAQRPVLGAVSDRERLLAWVERVLAMTASAPRAAERSPARRKVLAGLPGALAEIATGFRGTPDGVEWLRARCAETRHPDVRAAMDQAIDRLRRGGSALASSSIEALREALASSAKPPRDPARIREGVRGRGKKGRSRSR
jgi:hypothetical protein